MRLRAALRLTAIGLAALFGGGLACSTDEARLQPFSVPVAVVGSATVALDRLRMVVIFENDRRELAIGPDVAVTSTGTLMQVDLLHPADFGRPLREYPLLLTPDGQGLLVGRPRFVAYLDEDGSESYQDGVGFFGPDTTVGIDGFSQGIAWVPRPEIEIGRLSAEATDAFYRATDDLYTAFVPASVTDRGDFVPASLGFGLTIDIARLSVANAETVCDHRLRNIADPEPDVRLWVDRSLDAESLCGLDLADCRPVDTSTLTPPALPEGPQLNPFVRTVAQCRRRGGFEVLVVEENRVACDPTTCACNDRVDVEAVATSTSATPEWWPCADTVEYCASNLPLYRIDPACIPVEEDDDE